MKASKSRDALKIQMLKVEKPRNSVNVSIESRPQSSTMNELGDQIRKIIRTERQKKEADTIDTHAKIGKLL